MQTGTVDNGWGVQVPLQPTIVSDEFARQDQPVPDSAAASIGQRAMARMKGHHRCSVRRIAEVLERTNATPIQIAQIDASLRSLLHEAE